ncbi:hypothetical protein DIU38_024600 [Mucilaginibacter sp. P4]|uniref:hypothetical protein n=1 Tax=Mucilaginibacter sp. P4 TaxID=3383180 RepID=UPI0011EF71CB|nr:hypothetical protein [Mucilaginibacter gossypii]QEM19079.1 hypothetical protein DIU38_024600 [Mucilaginibacter gossypii]
MRKAVLAAFIAITVNTILLKAANMLAVRAESGGLLKLALSALPSAIHRPAFLKSAIFWFFFHYMIGFAMAGCYFFLFRNRLPRPGIVRGSLFSIFPGY